MTPELTEAAYEFVEFAKEALRKAGRPPTQKEIGRVVGSLPVQVGLAVRRKGAIKYNLLLKWARAFRNAGLGDAVLTVGERGPRFQFTFPDKTPHQPSTQDINLLHEWIPADSSDPKGMTCGHCFLVKPPAKDPFHILLRQECPVRLRERTTQVEDAVRRHRSAQGQDLCWLNDQELWRSLGDNQETPDRQVPPWPDFMAGCVAYRKMLDQGESLNRPVFGGLPWSNTVARSLFEIQKLPDNALPVYDKDPPIKKYEATEQGDVIWVQEHHRNLWHWSKDADGLRVLCGEQIPGAPAVTRKMDKWDPIGTHQCPACLRKMLESPARGTDV